MGYIIRIAYKGILYATPVIFVLDIIYIIMVSIYLEFTGNLNLVI